LPVTPPPRQAGRTQTAGLPGRPEGDKNRKRADAAEKRRGAIAEPDHGIPTNMATPLSQKHFLVVDDFADMRSVLRGILRSLSVSNFDLAATGNEALAILQKRRPDIVLCDYNLGEGKDGQQVLEEARERQLIGVVTIYVMLTAENTREMVMAAVEYVPDSYLTKPFTAELLRTRIEKLIQQKARLSGVNQALVAKNYTGAIHELNTLLVNDPKKSS
jgi:CheY-like chemotaxis protein